MAKIGNESRLILKLARERMKARWEAAKAQYGHDPSFDLYDLAWHQWDHELINIQAELEDRV